MGSHQYKLSPGEENWRVPKYRYRQLGLWGSDTGITTTSKYLADYALWDNKKISLRALCREQSNSLDLHHVGPGELSISLFQFISIVDMGMAEMDAEFSEGFNSDHQDVFQSIKWQGLAMYHMLQSKLQAWKPHFFWLNLGKRWSLCE